MEDQVEMSCFLLCCRLGFLLRSLRSSEAFALLEPAVSNNDPQCHVAVPVACAQVRVQVESFLNANGASRSEKELPNTR